MLVLANMHGACGAAARCKSRLDTTFALTKAGGNGAGPHLHSVAQAGALADVPQEGQPLLVDGDALHLRGAREMAEAFQHL